MAAATARAPNSHQSQEGAPLVWASAPAAGCSVVVDGDGTVDEAGAGDVGCGEAVAVTVAVDGLLVGVGPELGFNVGLVAEVVELGEDALEDALEDGLPRVGVVGLFSVRVGAGCSIVVVGDAVMVRDRDTVGAVMEPSPLHEATSTAARPMTAACETSVSAVLGTCRCLVVIVALLVAVLVGTFKTCETRSSDGIATPVRPGPKIASNPWSLPRPERWRSPRVMAPQDAPCRTATLERGTSVGYSRVAAVGQGVLLAAAYAEEVSTGVADVGSVWVPAAAAAAASWRVPRDARCRPMTKAMRKPAKLNAAMTHAAAASPEASASPGGWPSATRSPMTAP